MPNVQAIETMQSLKVVNETNIKRIALLAYGDEALANKYEDSFLMSKQRKK